MAKRQPLVRHSSAYNRLFHGARFFSRAVTFSRDAYIFSRDAYIFLRAAYIFSREAVTFSHLESRTSYLKTVSLCLCFSFCLVSLYIVVIMGKYPTLVTLVTPSVGVGSVGSVGCFPLSLSYIRARNYNISRYILNIQNLFVFLQRNTYNMTV